ncbi:MAG: MFS transporter, partial [Myxococcales bacterium]|nr:MFS transporter [Myxococcales bacterium]
MFGALAEKDFRLLWGGALCAFLGFFTSVVVQAVVAFELTGENTPVGWVVFARGLAMLLLGPVGGAMADRLSKRAVLLVCQAVATLVFAGLAILMLTDNMTVLYLVLGGFLVGMTFSFLGPTRQAYAVELVPEDRWGNAVALNQVALNASRVGGPALAGFILAQPVGATGAFTVMAILYLMAVLSHARLPPYVHATPPSKRSVLTDIQEGLRYVRERPHLQSLVLYFVLVIMFGFPYVVVLPGLVEHTLHRSADAVSVLFGTSALGGLAASLGVAPLADSKHAIAMHLGAGLAFAASLFGLSFVTTMLEANVAVIAVGLSTGVMTTLNGAVLLRASEPRYLGRVMSLALLAFAGFGVIGLPIGILADGMGESAC